MSPQGAGDRGAEQRPAQVCQQRNPGSSRGVNGPDGWCFDEFVAVDVGEGCFAQRREIQARQRVDYAGQVREPRTRLAGRRSRWRSTVWRSPWSVWPLRQRGAVAARPGSLSLGCRCPCRSRAAALERQGPTALRRPLGHRRR